MKKRINLSYNKTKLKRLPKIQGSSINLSINNTYVLIKNETPKNYSFIHNDIFPNIFSYNTKKNERILSPIKTKKKKGITPNIHTYNLVPTNTVLSMQKSPEDYITTNLLNKMICFFNIRELLMLMNINKKIHDFIKNTLVFQKYINLRNELKKGNLFTNLSNSKDFEIQNTKKCILKKSNNNIKIQIDNDGENSFLNNIVDKNSFLKYSLLNKKKIKLKKVLNPEIMRMTQKSINISNISNLNYNKNSVNIFTSNIVDSFNNTIMSSKTGSEKEKISKSDDKSIISNIDISNYDKLKLKLLSLIKNNGNKMSLVMRKYKLNSIEAKIIIYGIIETILLKKQTYEREKNDKNNFISSLILQNIKADKYMNYYIDPILNLEFDEIKKIQFDNIIISSINIMKKICHLLSRNFTCIKVLLLPNNNIDDNGAKLLFKALKYNKALTILNLSHNNISNKGIVNSDLFFKYNNSLNQLILSNNYLGSNGSNNLMNFLKFNKNSSLRTLDISYNGISEEGLVLLVEYIKTYGKLLSLFISGNYLCDTGLELFIKLLFNEDKNIFNKIILSYLDISNNNLTKKSCKYVNNIISFSSFINCINIGYNSLYNEGVNNIFAYVNTKSKLVSLDLSQTNINEECIKYISKKINKNIILRILNLSFNNLSKACIYLKELLSKDTNIKVLKLVSCKISENINFLFQGLSKNQNLETFDLSDNNIPMKDIILSDLLNAFKENKKLSNFFLDSCNINDIGINYIIKGIELNHSIKRLSLKNNYITNEKIDSLINSIKKNLILRKIDLEGNGLNKKIIESINSVLDNKLNNKI